MVYALERDGRTVYCSSFHVVSVLLSMGWVLRATDRWSRLVRERAAGSSPSTHNRSEQPS